MDKAEREANFPIHSAMIEKAWQLRKEGSDFVTIGNALGITRQKASRYVKLAYRIYGQQFEQEAVDTARLDVARIEDIIRALMPAAKKGCPKACREIRGFMETRASLLGHNKPQRLEVTTATVSLPEMIARLEAEVGAAVATDPATGDPTAADDDALDADLKKLAADLWEKSDRASLPPPADPLARLLNDKYRK